MIEFRSVSYQYPDGPVALKNINVSIEDGSFVAIIGNNGAGKTTFVKCMNGLIKPTSGDVIVGGINTRNATVARMAKNVGLVFQNSDNQLFSASVKEELEFSLNSIGFPAEEKDKRIEETLTMLNLMSFKEKSPFLLSGGERKRAAFASLICMGQDIFIADEPTQGQDEIQRKNIEEILKKMHDQGKTVIVITHDLDFIMHLATRVLIFNDGRILVDGPARDVFKSPKMLDLEDLTPTQELVLKWFLQSTDQGTVFDFSMDQEALISVILAKIKAAR